MLHLKETRCADCGKYFSESLDSMSPEEKVKAFYTDTITCACGRRFTRFDGSRYLDLFINERTEQVFICSREHKLIWNPETMMPLESRAVFWSQDLYRIWSPTFSWGDPEDWQQHMLRQYSMCLIGQLPVFAAVILDRAGWINLAARRRKLEDLIRKSPYALLAAMAVQIGA